MTAPNKPEQSQVVPEGAVEAFFREYVHLTNVALDITASTVRQCITAALPRIAPNKVETPSGTWAIDHSAGCPILVYENCSVIQDEQARYVLGLILAAKSAQAVGAQVGVPDGWQPIASAPRDARPLLLRRNDSPPFIGWPYSNDSWLDSQSGLRDPTHWAELPPWPAAPKPAAEGVKPDEAVVRDAEIPLLRQVAKRNLGRLIELGSDDKALMLSCLDELS